MDIIANDLPVFSSDISEYNGAKNYFDRNHESLVAHMNDLNNMWTGEAHDQFVSTFAQDETKIVRLADLLNEMLSELRFAHEEYTRCESTVSGIIESIAV